MLTPDGRGGGEPRVEKGAWSASVGWPSPPESIRGGLRSPRPDRQAQVEPAPKRTNPEQTLAFELTNVLCGRRGVDGPRPSGKMSVDYGFDLDYGRIGTLSIGYE